MRNIMRSRLFFLIAVIFVTGCLPDGDLKISVNYEPRDVGDGWEIASAGSHGFNTDKLQDIYDMMFSEDNYITSRSLLIVRNGKIISESYFRDINDISRKENVMGVTKGVTSILTGMGWDQDLFNVEDRLYRYIPGYFDGDMNKRDMTVGHMLTMTIGLEWDHQSHNADLFNFRRFPSTLRIVLTKPFLAASGFSFNYNPGPPQLAMGVLKHSLNRALGDTVTYESTDTIVNQLFGPLGIDDFVWEQHSDGLHIGGLGLHIRPRDLARIGQLCLQKGWWEGNQLVSSEWIKFSTMMHIAPEDTGSSLGYGYFWWIHKDNNAYFVMGDGGQYLYIVPDRNMVVVHTANPSVGSGYNGIELDDFFALVNMIMDAIE